MGGHEAFVELLQWRHQPLIMDRVFVSDLCDRYGLSTGAAEDLLKWKETSDTRCVSFGTCTMRSCPLHRCFRRTTTCLSSRMMFKQCCHNEADVAPDGNLHTKPGLVFF